MNFSELPRHVKDGLVYVNREELFHERFRHDPVLDELEEEELDLDTCHAHLRQIFLGDYEVEGVKLKPLTIAVWSWLWSISSPFVRNCNEAVKVEDLDRFFYMLDYGVKDDEVAVGYCLKISNDPAKLMRIISTVIKDAFSPLKMMPSSTQPSVGKQEIIYDASWLVSIVSAVHRLSGATQDDIFNKMPMMLALHYYVQYAKESGMKNIGQRTSEEIAKAKVRRTCELIAERLAELKIISEDEIEKYVQMLIPSFEQVQMMTTPAEEEKKDGD